MITVPEPAALLASLRARGYTCLPGVDVRIGASVLDQRDLRQSVRLIGA